MTSKYLNEEDIKEPAKQKFYNRCSDQIGKEGLTAAG